MTRSFWGLYPGNLNNEDFKGYLESQRGKNYLGVNAGELADKLELHDMIIKILLNS